MEAARSNGGGPYQWRRPTPKEATLTNGGGNRTNGGSPYQWRRPIPMEAARTSEGGQQLRRRPVTMEAATVPMEAANTNGGGQYQRRQPVLMKAYVYPSIFATINNYLWSITKGWWLAPGVLLIRSSAEMANDKKRWHRICIFFQPMGTKGLFLLPWPRNVDQIQADQAECDPYLGQDLSMHVN